MQWNFALHETGQFWHCSAKVQRAFQMQMGHKNWHLQKHTTTAKLTHHCGVMTYRYRRIVQVVKNRR